MSMARAVNAGRMGGSQSAPPPGTTFGGIRQAVGSRPGGRQVVMGDELYLWILVFLEVGAISMLRAKFSRYHGG